MSASASARPGAPSSPSPADLQAAAAAELGLVPLATAAALLGIRPKTFVAQRHRHGIEVRWLSAKAAYVRKEDLDAWLARAPRSYEARRTSGRAGRAKQMAEAS